MINKFRYKKPSQQQTTNNNGKICDKTSDSANKDLNDVEVDVKGCNISSDQVDLGMVVKDDSNEDNCAKVLEEKTIAMFKELFSQLQFSTETALPPDALRRALAESFFDQQRFQLGFMDDAAECFENMLLRIHTHIANGEAEDMCNAKHCIPHQKFAMTLVEQSVCGSCGATSEPLSYTQMVHYVSTSTLVYQTRTNSTRTQTASDSFGQLLRKAGSMGDVRVCPSACGAVIQIGRTLMNHPEIVSVGLVWNSERPTLEHIMEVFSTIGTTLRLADVFNKVVDNRWTETSMHNLVGIVTYYGKHYSTFFFHTKLRVWIYFDDATVREVGPRWDQVVEKCRKGRYQPLLLLYALPDGTPVNTENAPKQVTPLYNEKLNKKPPQSVLRRSITPSPEKPMIGNTRRAITPNPDGSLNQKPPLPRPYNEYQNLSVIQKNIYACQAAQDVDVVDGCIGRKDPEYVTRKSLDFNHMKPQVNVHRTLSSGSSSGIEGMSIPDHMNVPRRRDSGNWSGDRNSASSASSTTMENPYLYLVGKVPHGTGSVPGSPTRTKSDSSSGSSGVYDAGYDSYSLSSNDSTTMSTLQHLMKMGHLAKIPEDYNNSSNQISQSCDVLCDEADELLVKSRQLEDEHDLVLALALCNAAATKARAAMNAPYNNPQTLTLARMKHNTCIMRARSLHRRMTQTQINLNKDNPPEIRHTREGSSGSGRHSRQNSRDKGLHSRQNSRELLVSEKEKQQSTKSIEIYATLPKKKDSLKSKNINIGEDEEYMLYDKPPGRESRSIFSRSKNKDSNKKRSRSEDRNKMSRDFSIAPEIITGKDTLKKAKDEKEEKKDKEGKSKKQHKIRRKLLMGGLIKRKNRSMPDLTDATAVNDKTPSQPPTATVDDSNVGLKGTLENQASMCGYLSEGHLEFSGNSANPNLERSKLMRKSFHCSAGKILTAAKVPPPPPLRTTSQLSKSKLNGGEVCEEKSERPKYPLPKDINYYQNGQQSHYDVPPLGNNYHHHQQAPVSLPYVSNHQESPYYNNTNSSYYNQNTVVTRADVHHEQSPIKTNTFNNPDSGVDEVDCLPPRMLQNLDLPPYPSPIGSAIHSRQASEEFPPPPPPLDLSALDEHLPKLSPSPSPAPGSLLAQLQNKRQQILSQELEANKRTSEPVLKSSGSTWLRELQAKQAALRMKKNQTTESANDCGVDVVNTQKYTPGEWEAKTKSVKDLASKFEITEAPVQQKLTTQMYNNKPHPQFFPNNEVKHQNIGLDLIKAENPLHAGVLTLKKREESEPIAPEQIAEELREVEMLNAAVHKTLNFNHQDNLEDIKKTRLGKKKSVSFCDQVILVATAEEQEDDSYIPNPILERVLRTAMNKPETAAIRQEIISLREGEVKKQEIEVLEDSQNCLEDVKFEQQPMYVRRNSIDNLLSRQNSIGSLDAEQQLYGQSPQHLQVSRSPQNVHYNQNVQYNGQNALYNGQNSYNNQTYAPQIPQYNVQNPQYVTQYNSSYNNNPSVISAAQFNCQSVASSPPYNPQSPQPNSQYNCQNIQPTPQFNGQNAPSPAQNCQYNGHTPYRQSPYQQLPQNSPAYAAYYSNKSNSAATMQNNRPQAEYHPQQQFSSSPRNYNPQQIRQTTPSPLQMNGYSNSPVYQHPPSPAPSNVSSNYNYQQSMYRAPINNNYDVAQQHSPYQRVPMPADQQNNFVRSPSQVEYDSQQFQRQGKYPHPPDVYQRVPPPHDAEVPVVYQQVPGSGKYSPYQHILPSKQIIKKSVSFEPGTKGGCESPIPKAVVTPIIVNNANNSVPTDKTKCNLCRKKNVVQANLYCQDCEFYMSRFKPRS